MITKINGVVPILEYSPVSCEFPSMKGDLSLIKRFFTFYHTHKKQIRTCYILLAIGTFYYLIIQFTPFRIPCLFHVITGLACPGCGISHFCIRLIHFDINGAVRENLAIAVLIPIWILAFLIRFFFHPKWLSKGSTGEKSILFGSIALLLLFGILRNLPGLEFLLPSYSQ